MDQVADNLGALVDIFAIQLVGIMSIICNQTQFCLKVTLTSKVYIEI